MKKLPIEYWTMLGLAVFAMIVRGDIEPFIAGMVVIAYIYRLKTEE